MSTIAIILLNYNSTRLTKKCVQSLLSFKDEKDSYQIVIWDNASKNPPKPEEFPKAKLVLSKENYGFAEGNNKAVDWVIKNSKIEKQEIEYLLFLNNDTRVTKGMVRQLVETFQSNRETGIVVPKIYFEKGNEFHKKSYKEHERGKVVWYGGGGIDWKNMILFHKGVDEVDRGQFATDTSISLASRHQSQTFLSRIERVFFEIVEKIDLTSPLIQKPYTTEFATGCCMLTTPKIWKSVKGFDQRYFLYYEDADLSMRILQKRKEIVFEPNAVLYHSNAGSSDGSGSSLHSYYQTRNRIRFGLTYASKKTKLALLNEARRLFLTGNHAVRLGILHALGGQWGNQHHKLQNKQ